MYQADGLQKAQDGVFDLHGVVQVKRVAAFLHSLDELRVVFCLVVAKRDLMVGLPPLLDHLRVG